MCEGTKAKDLAYQSGTDGKLQVSIKRQQSFARSALNFLGGGEKSWRQKARKKQANKLKIVLFLHLAAKSC